MVARRVAALVAPTVSSARSNKKGANTSPTQQVLPQVTPDRRQVVPGGSSSQSHRDSVVAFASIAANTAGTVRSVTN
jgi:hypothetical protein